MRPFVQECAIKADWHVNGCGTGFGSYASWTTDYYHLVALHHITMLHDHIISLACTLFA
jgi:hypothetical protein